MGRDHPGWGRHGARDRPDTGSIQNDSGLPQGHKGAPGALLIRQTAHAASCGSGQGDRDHDALLFAKPSAVGSAGYRFPAKHLGWS
jgi:hypothetical protein